MLNTNHRDCFNEIVRHIRTVTSNGTINNIIKLFFIAILVGTMLSSLLEKDNPDYPIIVGMILVIGATLLGVVAILDVGVAIFCDSCPNLQQGVNKLGRGVLYTGASVLGVGAGLFIGNGISLEISKYRDTISDDVKSMVPKIG